MRKIEEDQQRGHLDGGQGKRAFVKKDMFNGPNITERKKGSVGCGNMEITGLLGQSSLGRKARTEIRLLFLKPEWEVRKLK